MKKSTHSLTHIKFNVIDMFILQYSKKFCEIKNKVYMKKLQIVEDEGNITFCVAVKHVNLGFEFSMQLVFSLTG